MHETWWNHTRTSFPMAHFSAKHHAIKLQALKVRLKVQKRLLLSWELRWWRKTAREFEEKQAFFRVLPFFSGLSVVYTTSTFSTFSTHLSILALLQLSTPALFWALFLKTVCQHFFFSWWLPAMVGGCAHGWSFQFSYFRQNSRKSQQMKRKCLVADSRWQTVGLW